MATGCEDKAELFLKEFQSIFEIGKLKNIPGYFRNFAINMCQGENSSTETNADEKLEMENIF